RGEGYGKAVWDAGMARLGDRTIGLDGVVELQANYRGMGFAPVYRTIRFVGTPNAPAAADSDICVIGPEADVLD
ncbi:MAG: GNAT family N-acetyltransferase, partial [Mesorhizobium sp.]